MWPETRWKLVGLGVTCVVSGIVLIVKPWPKDPTVDSPTGRLVGGLVLIAFGLVVGAVGINLMATGR
jgi:hypothetical protein